MRDYICQCALQKAAHFCNNDRSLPAFTLKHVGFKMIAAQATSSNSHECHFGLTGRCFYESEFI